MKKLFGCLTIFFFAFCLMMPTKAIAGLTQSFDRTSFESSGTIFENYGYEDFGTGYSYPPNPWTTHGVTYNTGANLIIGTGTTYAPISNVFANNGWSPVPADIGAGPQYDLFGLDLAYLGSSSEITFTVFTNLGSYVFGGIFAPNANTAQDFYGFTADAGEYFTGFNLASAGESSAPVIDNVTLGVVPEPATLLLLGSGLLGLVGFGRKKKEEEV